MSQGKVKWLNTTCRPKGGKFRYVRHAHYSYLDCPFKSGGHRAHICPRVTGIWSLPQTSVQCLTFCFAASLRRGPNVALSSTQSAAIECFLACLDRPTSLHPPLGRLGRRPRIAKSDGSTAGQPGPWLESVFCAVCVCSAFPVCCLAVTNITVCTSRAQENCTGLGYSFSAVPSSHPQVPHPVQARKTA